MQTRNDYPQFLKDHNYCCGVELGVFKGEFSKIILDSWDGVLYLVDVWRSLPDNQYEDISNHKNHDNVYLETINNISGYEERAFMIRMSGDSAVNLFQDQSLDFIYIDANHSYLSVKRDIHLWYPKIRKGGMISGHDYLPQHLFNNAIDNDLHMYSPSGVYIGLFGVNKAVNDFCDSYKLQLKTTIDKEFFSTWWVIK